METTCAIYLRISKDREGEELGVTRQREDCVALARKLGFKVHRIYMDNDRGASRHSRKVRPEYRDMLRDARAGLFTVILAYTSARLTRRPREHEDLIDLATDYGVKYEYIRSPSFDLNTAQGRQIARTLAAQDAATAEISAELIQRAQRQRAEQGEVHGGQIHYAYDKKWSGGELVNIKPNARRAKVTKEAARRALAGETLEGIAVDFNRRGIHTAKGDMWRKRTLQRLLTSPTIAGLREYDRQFYPGKWKAIVDREDWERLREIIRTPNNKPTKRNGNRVKYALSTLVFHTPCGCRAMTGTIHNGYAMFSCITPGCRGGIKMEDLEQYVLAQVLAVIDEKALAAATRHDDSTARDLMTVIAKDERALQRIQDDYDDEAISETEYKRRRHRIEERLATARHELQQATSQSMILPSARELERVWATKDNVWKRTVMSAVIERIDVGPHPADMAVHITPRRGEDPDAYTDRLAAYRAEVLRRRVTVTWRL